MIRKLFVHVDLELLHVIYFFALEILGFKNLFLYDGSWAEWGKK